MIWWSACPHLNLHVLQKPKNLRNFLFWVVGGEDLCRNSSRVLMRPFGSSHALAVPAQTRSKSETSPFNFFFPKGQRAPGQGGSLGMLISGTNMSIVDIWQNQFLMWSIPRTLPCGQSRTGKLPPPTSSCITKCFCAGLVKTLETLVSSHISK